MTNYSGFDRYVTAFRGGAFNIETEESIIRPSLSTREERFEWWRRTIGLFAGPVIFLILYLIPTPSLSEEGHVLGAVLGLVIAFWISEAIPIPVTALLGAVLCVILGVAPAKTVFTPFADPIIFLFVGSFIIARAMSIHKLDRRFASMVIPVMIAVSQAAGVSPIPPALGGCLGASFGFMLPVSTPPNAIVYGSGMVPILSMVRAGIIIDTLGFFIIWLGLRILCPLLGLI